MHAPRFAVGLVIILSGAMTFAAAPQGPSELQKALAAAERARATPKGQAYQSAFLDATKEMMFSGVRECLPISAPGVSRAPSFQCVLIIGKTGKPKWIIRDSRDPMAQCFYAKLVQLTFPPPPADNWPVTFGINLQR